MVEQPQFPPEPEVNPRKARTLAVKADGHVLTRDIWYVPFDPKTKLGNYYEYDDGSPADYEALAYFASIGVID